MEKSTYRDNLAALYAFFGEKRLITIQDTANYLGCDKRTVVRLYDAIFTKKAAERGFRYTTIENLARTLSI